MSLILDQHGKPILTAQQEKALSVIKTQKSEIRKLQGKIRQQLSARYDAAQDHTGNIKHWEQADNLDPHSAANLTVRRKLRSRSRYEVIENNPFLKGILLTICNDFVGTGPSLQIRDSRIPKESRRDIEKAFSRWFKKNRIRQKLWRMRMAKITDGETFARAYTDPRRTPSEVTLNFQVLEADRVSHYDTPAVNPGNPVWEIDGVRFDRWEEPLEYHILHQHPTAGFHYNPIPGGSWVSAAFCIHWFRQDRGWLRGIPETTASLPLCALLRRYTLAVVQHAETAADFTALVETESPAFSDPWDTDSEGNPDPEFDIFPIEMGMITALPYGQKVKQLNPVPLGVQYDEFVGALLREITRPILVPFNMALGTSKDSNMASAVVDQHIYEGGQQAERLHCEESVLHQMFFLWWSEFKMTKEGKKLRVPGMVNQSPELMLEPPEHCWRWDRVGLEHTDPLKVANSLKTLHDKNFLTDRDIQETYYNRDVEDWREEALEDKKFRDELNPLPDPVPPEGQPPGKPPVKKSPVKKPG